MKQITLKKILGLFMVLSFALFMTSCGSNKKTTEIYPDKSDKTEVIKRVKVEKEECEEMSVEKSDLLRGYGVGTSLDKMFARDISNANARNEIVNQIQVLASNAISRMNQQHLQNNGDKGLVGDEISKIETEVKSAAEELIGGVRVICSNTYMIGQKYEYHICVELTNQDYRSIVTKSVEQSLTNDQKLRIDFRAEKVAEMAEEEKEKLRKAKQAGL